MKKLIIQPTTNDPAIDIALDTIRIGKQALIFVNSKRSAEAVAEKIAKKSTKSIRGCELSKKALSVLSNPTKQCKRLSFCLERNIAFHHAGLASKQRQLIEDAFRAGDIKIISATPTLAAGVDTPAFRTIIRDLKRYTSQGLKHIPVLEYHQMSGRSGRPDYNDEYGEAITIAKNDSDLNKIMDKYVNGKPESIYSKIASMPVLRTYCLSLLATGFCSNYEEIIKVFSDTFFAHQYKDIKGVNNKIRDTINDLAEWGFLKLREDDFLSADEIENNNIHVTRLGRRVSELYIDPLSAHNLILSLKEKNTDHISYLIMVCSAIEARPLLRIRASDYEKIHLFLDEQSITNTPSLYDPEYENYLEIIKTAMMLNEWTKEMQEDYFYEEYNVRPGELKAKLDIIDWLLYSSIEIARILKLHYHISPLSKTRTRIKYGVKEDIIPLLLFKNIGRVRARKLRRNGIKDAKDLAKVSSMVLSQLIGDKTAKSIKEQLGQDYVQSQVSKTKRLGQLSLHAKQFNK